MKVFLLFYCIIFFNLKLKAQDNLLGHVREFATYEIQKKFNPIKRDLNINYLYSEKKEYDSLCICNSANLNLPILRDDEKDFDTRDTFGLVVSGLNHSVLALRQVITLRDSTIRRGSGGIALCFRALHLYNGELIYVSHARVRKVEGFRASAIDSLNSYLADKKFTLTRSVNGYLLPEARISCGVLHGFCVFADFKSEYLDTLFKTEKEVFTIPKKAKYDRKDIKPYELCWVNEAMFDEPASPWIIYDGGEISRVRWRSLDYHVWLFNITNPYAFKHSFFFEGSRWLYKQYNWGWHNIRFSGLSAQDSLESTCLSLELWLEEEGDFALSYYRPVRSLHKVLDNKLVYDYKQGYNRFYFEWCLLGHCYLLNPYLPKRMHLPPTMFKARQKLS